MSQQCRGRSSFCCGLVHGPAGVGGVFAEASKTAPNVDSVRALRRVEGVSTGFQSEVIILLARSLQGAAFVVGSFEHCPKVKLAPWPPEVVVHRS